MSADIASKLKADSASEAAPLFVINLCASTSPMALTHPNTPELKRYTFFVSRQREDGRERFRLHMGYFASQEEAESLLIAVRDVYPAAWAGPAPTSGMPKRARVTAVPPLVIAAPTAVTEPQPAAPVAAAPGPTAPAAVAVPAARPAPVLETMSNVRDVLAQLDDQAAAPAARAAARPVESRPAAAPATAPAPVRAAPPQPAAASIPVASAAPTQRVTGTPVDVPVIRPAKDKAAPAPVASPAAARPAPAPANVPAAVASATPAAEPARPSAKELDASQTLQVLEATSATPVASVTMDDELAETSDVRIVTPEDTQTLRDIRLDAQNNAPPCFAVQLVWAVTPIDVSSLPHLAIFDAYTLYNVEGSRQGRKWYGLRLGFFSDPNSATQVAHYVRADYQAVAVVPVAVKERDHARGGNISSAAPRLGETRAPQKPQDEVKLQAQGLDGFELLQDDRPRPEKRDVEDIGGRAAGEAAPKLARDRIAAAVNAPRPAAAVSAGAKGKVPVAAPAAPKATGRPTGKRVVVRKRPETPLRTAPGAPQPLESTLEILGASTLTIDESREIVNDSAVRKPIEKKQGSRFAKLLNRLSGG